jgi:hypothetical protein
MRFGTMKAFEGTETIDGKEVRVIIAATSRNAASVALEKFGLAVSVRRLMTYWKQDPERIICEIAMSEPGQAFAQRADRAFYPLPVRPLVRPEGAPEPRVPKDPEGRKAYDKEKREDSDTNKRARGERRVSTWIPKEAADALDRLTGGSKSKGAVQAALVQAILAASAGAQPTAKRKAA